MPAFEIVDVPEQPTAVVRATVPMSGIRGFFDRAFGEVFAAVGKQGVAPAGPPFGYYGTPPGDTIDVTAGVAVTSPIEPDGDVEPGTLGGGRAIMGSHLGPYEDLSATYERLLAWAEDEHITLAGPMWELYLTDPGAEPDQAKWRTDIYWSVAE